MSNWSKRSGFGLMCPYGCFESCCCAQPRRHVRAFSHWLGRKVAIKFSAFLRLFLKMSSTKLAFKMNVTMHRRRPQGGCDAGQRPTQ